MGTVTRLLPQGSLGLVRAPSHTPGGFHSLTGGSPTPDHAHRDMWSIHRVPHLGKLRQGAGGPPPARTHAALGAGQVLWHPDVQVHPCLLLTPFQLTMNDFSVHRIIGRGGFGEVYGCRKADTGKM